MDSSDQSLGFTETGNGSDTAIELFKGFTLKTITPDEILFANISH